MIKKKTIGISEPSLPTSQTNNKVVGSSSQEGSTAVPNSSTNTKRLRTGSISGRLRLVCHHLNIYLYIFEI